MPAASAAPGMSSTPSISPMSQSRWSAAHRREADAAVAHHQVVTPCQLDGDERGSHVTCPS